MTIRMMAGILQGLNAAEDRSIKISAARDDKRQKDEALDLEKRKVKLLEDEYKLKSDPDPNLEMIFKMAGDEFKAKETISKVEDNKIAAAQYKTQDIIKTLKRTGQKAMMSMANGGVGDINGAPLENIPLQAPQGSKVAGSLIPQRNKIQMTKSPLESLDWSYNTGTKSMTIKPKDTDTVTQKAKEERLAREQGLRDTRYDIETMYKRGGGINFDRVEEVNKSLGIDILPELEAGRGEPYIGPDGKKSFRVLSDKEWDAKVSQGKFSSTEIEQFQDIKAENSAWKDVVKSLNDLGINDQSIEGKDIGEISFADVNTAIGPMSIPARFNLVGQYAKDPKYTAVKRDIELAFQAFRKRVTGAAAATSELNMLRQIIPSLKDNPKVFFASINKLMENSERAFNDRVELYERFGRDTSKVKGFLSESEGKGAGKYSIDQEIETPDGRIFKVVGGDMNDPEVEEVKK